VAGMAPPAEPRWELLDRLLLPGSELRGAVDEPHGVMQVQNVDPGNRSVGVDELGVEAGDISVLLRPEVVGAVVRRPEVDDVLARVEGDRAVAVGEVLDARVVDVSDGVRLVRDRRALARALSHSRPGYRRDREQRYERAAECGQQANSRAK